MSNVWQSRKFSFLLQKRQTYLKIRTCRCIKDSKKTNISQKLEPADVKGSPKTHKQIKYRIWKALNFHPRLQKWKELKIWLDKVSLSCHADMLIGMSSCPWKQISLLIPKWYSTSKSDKNWQNFTFQTCQHANIPSCQLTCHYAHQSQNCRCVKMVQILSNMFWITCEDKNCNLLARHLHLHVPSLLHLQILAKKWNSLFPKHLSEKVLHDKQKC